MKQTKAIKPIRKYHYIFTKEFEDSQQLKYYSSLRKLFGWKETLTIKDADDGTILKVYIPHIAVLFTSHSEKFFVRETQKEETILTYDFYTEYKKGYDEGLTFFHSNYTVSGEIIYGNRGIIFERTLHKLYFHPKDGKVIGQWNSFENMQPFVISFEEIYKYGYYAAIVKCVYELRENHPVAFSNFEKCSETKEHSVTITEERETDPKFDMILKHLKPLKGKYRYENILSDSDFSMLTSNIHYLIEKNKLPKPILKIRHGSSISMDFIRKTIYNLHREIYGRRINKLWIELLKAQFSGFDNTEMDTLQKTFSIYKKDYNKDLELITY